MGTGNARISGNRMFCEVCNEESFLRLPISIDLMVKKLNAFSNLHEDCEEPGKSTEDLLGSIGPQHLPLLSGNDIKDKVTLSKMIDWQNDYSDDVDWPCFRSSWIQCGRCKMYSEEQCFCYAR